MKGTPIAAAVHRCFPVQYTLTLVEVVLTGKLLPQSPWQDARAVLDCLCLWSTLDIEHFRKVSGTLSTVTKHCSGYWTVCMLKIE